MAHKAASYARRHRTLTTQRGISFVETSVVLALAGLLSWAAFGAYESVNDQRSRQQGLDAALELQSHLRSFSLRHGRLPCPDPSALGTGYEGTTDDACSPGNQVGWFPYVGLGLAVPQDGLKARYAVFRAEHSNLAQDADLAITKERTGDAADDAPYQNVSDLIVALNNIGELSLSPSRAYLTGDGGPTGPIDCAANPVTAVAYWMVLPLSDRDGSGDRLDAPHTASSPCASSPAAPVRNDSDDVVLSESPAQLAGWLRSNSP